MRIKRLILILFWKLFCWKVQFLNKFHFFLFYVGIWAVELDRIEIKIIPGWTELKNGSELNDGFWVKFRVKNSTLQNRKIRNQGRFCRGFSRHSWHMDNFSNISRQMGRFRHFSPCRKFDVFVAILTLLCQFRHHWPNRSIFCQLRFEPGSCNTMKASIPEKMTSRVSFYCKSYVTGNRV